METFRCEYVRCGKPSCKSCPHGPYWYAYWKENKKTRKRYVGKDRPGFGPEDKDGEGDYQERIFDKTKATVNLACEILGVVPQDGWAQVKGAYRKLSLKYHPDREGDTKTFAKISAAWSFLCAARGWK